MNASTEIEKSVIFEMDNGKSAKYYKICKSTVTDFYSVYKVSGRISTQVFRTMDRPMAFEMFNAKIAEATRIATAIIPW